MKAQKLTKSLIAGLQPGPKDYAVSDKGSPLRLKVTQRGAKIYQIVRRIDGKTRTLKIGDAALLTLEQARREAKRLAAEIELGIDPAGKRRAKKAEAKKAEIIFSEVAERYISAYTKTHTTESAKAESRAARRAAAVFANLPPAAVDVAAVKRLRDSYAYSPSELRKVFGAAKRVMDLAVDEGLVERNVFLGITPPKPPKARSNYPGLADLAAIWRACVATRGTGARIIRFLIAMPLRLNAAASLTWGEVNMNSRELRLSAGDGRKVQEQQRLPLPGLAVELLREVEPAAPLPDHLVFPSASPRNTGGRYSGWSQTVARLRARSGVSSWTPHDFRRAAVSLVAELRPDIDETALDRWLTHKASSTNSGVKAVYQRAQGFTKMRAAADAWDEILRGALEPTVSGDSSEAA